MSDETGYVPRRQKRIFDPFLVAAKARQSEGQQGHLTRKRRRKRLMGSQGHTGPARLTHTAREGPAQGGRGLVAQPGTTMLLQEPEGFRTPPRSPSPAGAQCLAQISGWSPGCRLRSLPSSPCCNGTCRSGLWDSLADSSDVNCPSFFPLPGQPGPEPGTPRAWPQAPRALRSLPRVGSVPCPQGDISQQSPGTCVQILHRASSRSPRATPRPDTSPCGFSPRPPAGCSR